MPHTPYPSDMSDEQWAHIMPLIPPPKSNFIIGGRDRTTDMRAMINAILYLVRTGCPWSYLPKEYPPQGTVKSYYYSWTKTGAWQYIHDALRAEVRKHEGKEAAPSAAIIDSQSVKTTEKKGSVAMMPARRSRAASVTSWSTR